MEKEEILANYAHMAWSGWMKYLFLKSKENEDGTVTLSKENVKRWKRQTETSYYDLSEEEKYSDKLEAYIILKLINEYDNTKKM